MQVTKRGKILPRACSEKEIKCEFYDYPDLLAQAQSEGWKLRAINIKWKRREAVIELYRYNESSIQG